MTEKELNEIIRLKERLKSLSYDCKSADDICSKIESKIMMGGPCEIDMRHVPRQVVDDFMKSYHEYTKAKVDKARQEYMEALRMFEAVEEET